MRLVKRQFESDGSGIVTLLPEEPEDMVRTFLERNGRPALICPFNSGMRTTSFGPLTSLPHLPFDVSDWNLLLRDLRPRKGYTPT